MILPDGVSEQEFTEAALKAADMIARKYKFGFYEREDIKQEALVFAIELMASNKYDPARQKLAGFIYRHMKNRVINLHRNKMHRTEVPCQRCASGKGHGRDKKTCKVYDRWINRNTSKKNIMCPVDIGYINDEDESNTRVQDTLAQDLDTKHLEEKINSELPVRLRAEYLKLRSGVKLPAGKIQQIREAITHIIGNAKLEKE